MTIYEAEMYKKKYDKLISEIVKGVDDILIDGFSRQLVNVDASGNVTVRILDKDGNIIKGK